MTRGASLFLVKTQTWARQIKFARESYLLRRHKIAAVFIHGHMRSGSTVLLHILCSNPYLYGIGETHACYRSAVDVARLYRQIERTLGHRLPSTSIGIIDKLLHNRDFDAGHLPATTRHLFIVREPAGAVRSMCHPRFSPIANQTQAESYYVQRLLRLKALRQEVRTRGQPNLSLTHAELTQAPEPLLSRMTTWLALPQPLSAEYDMLPTTGQPVYGDTSTHIRSGRILDQVPGAPVALPRPVDDIAHRAYEEYRNADGHAGPRTTRL